MVRWDPQRLLALMMAPSFHLFTLSGPGLPGSCHKAYAKLNPKSKDTSLGSVRAATSNDSGISQDSFVLVATSHRPFVESTGSAVFTRLEKVVVKTRRAGQCATAEEPSVQTPSVSGQFGGGMGQDVGRRSTAAPKENGRRLGRLLSVGLVVQTHAFQLTHNATG